MLNTIIGVIVLAIIAFSLASAGYDAWKLTKDRSLGFRLGVIAMSVMDTVLRLGRTTIYLLGFVLIVILAKGMI